MKIKSLFFFILIAFVFFSCEIIGISGNDEQIKFSNKNQNDQGEDEDNGKKPPVKIPPVTDPVDEEVSIPFAVSGISNTMGSTENHELFTIVYSKEELDKAASQRYFQYWTDKGGPYNVYYLKGLTDKYNDDFFTENALVLYLFGAGNSGGKLSINQLTRNKDELTIVTNFHEGDLTAISYWTVVLDVTKADIDGITGLKSRNECNCQYFAHNLILASHKN